MKLFSNTRFALLMCSALLLSATTAFAQKPVTTSPQKITSQGKKHVSPNKKKDLTPGTKPISPKEEQQKQSKKTNTFEGIIDCSKATKDVTTSDQKASVITVKQSDNAAAFSAKEKAVQDIRFCYTKEGSIVLSNNVYIQMVMKEEPMLELHAKRDKKWITAIVPLCKILPDMCEMMKEFSEVSHTKDPDAMDMFFHTHYQPTSEMREIAGAKATLYYMVLNDRKIPVWVDEHTSTDGMAWPYIGLPHPVLGGQFFMPLEDIESTSIEFDAQKILPVGSDKFSPDSMKKEFESSENVPTDMMMETIRENEHR